MLAILMVLFSGETSEKLYLYNYQLEILTDILLYMESLYTLLKIVKHHFMYISRSIIKHNIPRITFLGCDDHLRSPHKKGMFDRCVRVSSP